MDWEASLGWYFHQRLAGYDRSDHKILLQTGLDFRKPDKQPGAYAHNSHKIVQLPCFRGYSSGKASPHCLETSIL